MDPTGDDPAPARAAHRSSGACRKDSGTNTRVHWPEGESSPYHVQHQAKRRLVHTVPDPDLLSISHTQTQPHPSAHALHKDSPHRRLLRELREAAPPQITMNRTFVTL